MPFPIEMDWLGWIVVGFVAGALSGFIVRGSTARGCLANTAVGILGGLVGGLAARAFGLDRIVGFVAAVVVAFAGAVAVRILLEAVSRD